MFPITCNAFGDIVSAIQIIRDIATALNESRGATQACRDFAYGLERMSTTMEEAYQLASSSSNCAFQETVLNHVRHFSAQLHEASKRTSGFEVLLAAQDPAISTAFGLRKWLYRRKKMLRWHFMRQAKAADYTKRFVDQCSLIQLDVICLHE